MPTPHRRAIARMLLVGSIAAGATFMLGGCYERVVRASGPGATRYDVYEPYQVGDTWLENAVMGPRPNPQQR